MITIYATKHGHTIHITLNTTFIIYKEIVSFFCMNQRSFMFVLLVGIIASLASSAVIITIIEQKVFAATPSPASPTAATANLHSYTNSTYGVALQYPPNWIVTSRSQPQGTNNTVFAIVEFDPPVSQDPNADTFFIAGIDNTTRKATPTLDEYLHKEIISYRSAANLTDFKVINADTNVTVGGHPGYLLYYTQKLQSDPAPRMHLETGTIAGGNIYYMLVSSGLPDKQFTAIILPQVIQMMKSFQILQPAPVNNNKTHQYHHSSKVSLDCRDKDIDKRKKNDKKSSC